MPDMYVCKEGQKSRPFWTNPHFLIHFVAESVPFGWATDTHLWCYLGNPSHVTQGSFADITKSV